jgi:hypothetical protein
MYKGFKILISPFRIKFKFKFKLSSLLIIGTTKLSTIGAQQLYLGKYMLRGSSILSYVYASASLSSQFTPYSIM